MIAKGKRKFYAVAAGRKPGIYTEWFGPRGAEAQVHGIPGARYKGFATRAEAEEWLRSPGPTPRATPARERVSEAAAESGPEPGLEAVAGPGGEAGGELRRAPSREPAGELAHEAAEGPIRGPDRRKGRILIFTDGGSIYNPGPGGYGIVIIEDGKRRELSAGFRETTNNRMELMGAIVALSQFQEPARILLTTDSQYVVNGITKGWAERWRRNGWMRNRGAPAENSDLWEQLLALSEKHDVLFEWVRGHAGHAENERCDELVRAASAKRGLPPDTNYEKRPSTGKQGRSRFGK